MSSKSEQQLETRIDELAARLEKVEQQLEPAAFTGELAGVTDDEGRSGVELLRESRREDAREELIHGGNDKHRALHTAIRETIIHFESAYGESTPIDYILEELTEQGYDTDDVQATIDTLRRQGDIYEPKSDHVRVV